MISEHLQAECILVAFLHQMKNKNCLQIFPGSATAGKQANLLSLSKSSIPPTACTLSASRRCVTAFMTSLTSPGIPILLPFGNLLLHFVNCHSLACQESSSATIFALHQAPIVPERWLANFSSCPSLLKKKRSSFDQAGCSYGNFYLFIALSP